MTAFLEASLGDVPLRTVGLLATPATAPGSGANGRRAATAAGALAFDSGSGAKHECPGPAVRRASCANVAARRDCMGGTMFRGSEVEFREVESRIDVEHFNATAQ